MRDERVALEEARGLRELGEPHEARAPRLSPSFTAAASSRPRAPFARSSSRAAPGEKAPSAATRHEVALVEQRAREAAQGRALAPAVALERDAVVEGVEQHVVAAHQPLAEPLLPRLARRARPPAPRRPCGSRGGPRTRAAAPAGSGRTARGWSRRSRARAPRGRPPRGRARRRGVRASARARSSRSRRRSFMVVAAFSVKVTAAISSRRAAPARTIASMRSTSSVVLPVPAPASSTRLVAWSRRARSRASSSTGRKRAHETSLSRRNSCSEPVADLDRLAALQQRLRPADRGEVAEVAGGRLLHEDPARHEVHEPAEEVAELRALRELGAEGHLPPAVHVVEEGVHHRARRAGASPPRGRRTGSAAACRRGRCRRRPSGRGRSCSRAGRGRPRAAVDAVDLPGDAQRPAVAEVDLERLGVVRLLVVARLAEPEAQLEVGGRRPRGGGRLARQPAPARSRGSARFSRSHSSVKRGGLPATRPSSASSAISREPRARRPRCRAPAARRGRAARAGTARPRGGRGRRARAGRCGAAPRARARAGGAARSAAGTGSRSARRWRGGWPRPGGARRAGRAARAGPRRPRPPRGRRSG